MKTFDLYGFENDDIDVVRRNVEEALGLNLEENESSYHCGQYYRHGSSGQEHLILQRNFDSLEGEWAEDEFREVPLLLYVNATRRGDEIQQALVLQSPTARLLRRDTFDG
jgi:hypothetical protein